MSNAMTITNELDILTIGDILVKSGFFADATQQAQAVVKVLAGAEIGFGPIASMTGVYIVKGKPALSANLIAAAVKRSGKYNYRVKEHTETACTIIYSENGESCGESRFTMDDAKRAGLTQPNWQKYPRNMLFARAMSNGARWFCPDIFGGPIYTPEELGTPVDGETGEIVEGRFTPTAPKTPIVKQTTDLTAPPPAFDYKTPKGIRLGDCSPERLREMQTYVDEHPAEKGAAELGANIVIALDYMAQFEAEEGSDG